MSNPLFKIGDTVELTGVYRKDKGFFKRKSGIITYYSFDKDQIALGASGHVYKVEGIGCYGQGALKIKK